jgi:hypothetical protein
MFILNCDSLGDVIFCYFLFSNFLFVWKIGSFLQVLIYIISLLEPTLYPLGS